MTISLTALASAALNAVIFGFWKPWLGAYGGEKGKNLARKEDLATILAEVRAVTNTQKELEATLNSGVWNRQTLWVHKRDAYADVLKAGGKVARHYGKVATILRMLEGSDDNRAKYTLELNVLLDESIALMAELYSVCSVAELFISAEAESLLNHLTVSFLGRRMDY